MYDLEPQKLTGIIKYVGKIDSEYIDNRIYVGVKLDDPGKDKHSKDKHLLMLITLSSLSLSRSLPNQLVTWMVCTKVNDTSPVFLHTGEWSELPV